MNLAKYLCCLALLAAALGSFTGSAAADGDCGRTGVAPAKASDHQLRTTTLCLVNRVRERNGVAPLDFNWALRESATAHSQMMVRSGSFSHYGPYGSTPTSRIAHAGYLARVSYYRLAENIAAGTGPQRGSPIAIVSEWMHSAVHRANILDPGLHDFGVGVARGDAIQGSRDSGATYTLDFGARSR